MALHRKLPKKHCTPRVFEGRVGDHMLRAEGKSKREAVKRLRLAFSQAGKPTIINAPKPLDHEPALMDRLEVRGPLARAEM